jgi:hypothetical protein
MGNFSLRVTPAGVNPNLLRWVETAAQSSPLDVVVTSGKRLGDPRFHGKGSAIDVKLYDTQTGQEIPNYQDARSFNTYQGFANLVRGAQMQLNPELANQLRWGGYFSGGKGQYGALDLMHFDIGGDTTGMAGGGWDTGLTPEQAQIWGLTAGTGGYGGGGAAPTASPGGLAGAFQDAIAPPEQSPWAKTLGSIGSSTGGSARKAASQPRVPEPPPVPVIEAEPAPSAPAPAPDPQVAPEAAVSGLADLFKVAEIPTRIGQAARLPGARRF